MIQGDAHLRHHGQWRTIKGRVYTAAALAALATNQMKDDSEAFRFLRPLKTRPKEKSTSLGRNVRPRRKWSPSLLGENYALKKSLVNLGVK